MADLCFGTLGVLFIFLVVGVLALLFIGGVLSD